MVNFSNTDSKFSNAFSSNNFTVTLGSIDRSVFESNLLVMTTDNKVVHQSYVDDSFAFDVALITLPVPIATNGSKKSIAHLYPWPLSTTIAGVEWKNTFVIVY
jgi:hypothetical protein